MNKRSLIAAFVMGMVVSTGMAADVAFPSGYRDWRHVKSMVIEEGHPLYSAFGGIHHIYANDKAIQGYRAGRFPEGSVIVFDLLEANRNDNALSEGARKVLGVMVKDSKRYSATGGWGFEGFSGGDPKKRAVGANAKSACFDCHAQQQSRDFVFSSWRD